MSAPSPSTSVSPRTAAPQAFGNDLLGAALLSGVAGYVDTAGFLALYGLLTAHVTGDLVTAGVVVVENVKTGAATRLAMIPIFMLAVAATALFVRRHKRRGGEPLAALLGLMTAALALFGTTGVALQRWAVAPDDWAVALIGSTGVVAMAIQNTLMRDALSSFCPTTIMTGNLTQVTIDLVDILLPAPHADAGIGAAHRRGAQLRLRRFGYPLVGFTVGAGFGALLTHALGLWSIALPTAVVASLTVVAWRASRASAARRATVLATSTARAVGEAAQPRDDAERATPSQHRRGEPQRVDEPPSVGGGRRASGTRMVSMQVSEEANRPAPQESGTYAAAPISRPEAPTSSRSPRDRRRVQS